MKQIDICIVFNIMKQDLLQKIVDANEDQSHILPGIVDFNKSRKRKRHREKTKKEIRIKI